MKPRNFSFSPELASHIIDLYRSGKIDAEGMPYVPPNDAHDRDDDDLDELQEIPADSSLAGFMRALDNRVPSRDRAANLNRQQRGEY